MKLRVDSRLHCTLRRVLTFSPLNEPEVEFGFLSRHGSSSAQSEGISDLRVVFSVSVGRNQEAAVQTKGAPT